MQHYDDNSLGSLNQIQQLTDQPSSSNQDRMNIEDAPTHEILQQSPERVNLENSAVSSLQHQVMDL